MEEGEIPVTTQTAVVIVDIEEDAPVAADVPEAGQVTVAVSPPAAAEPEVKRAPPTTGEREPAAKKPHAGAETARERRDGPESSSQQLVHRSTRPRVEGPQEGPTRPVPKFNSMVDAAQAARLLSGVRTAESEKEMRGMSHSALLDMVMVVVVQMANGAIGLREAVVHSSDALTRAMVRAKKYRKESVAQSQSLARLHQEAKAREENLGGRLKEAESRAGAEGGRAATAEAKLELVLERLKAATAREEELNRQLRCTEEEVRAARGEAQAAAERAAIAEKAAVEAGHEKAGAVAYADEANARAEEAEGRAKEAGAQAQEAMARAERAEAEAGHAISSYKASAEFGKEVLEASLDAYVKGFEMCKSKVSAALKIDTAELEGIQPGEVDEEPAEEEDDQGEPGPNEP